MSFPDLLTLSFDLYVITLNITDRNWHLGKEFGLGSFLDVVPRSFLVDLLPVFSCLLVEPLGSLWKLGITFDNVPEVEISTVMLDEQLTVGLVDLSPVETLHLPVLAPDLSQGVSFFGDATAFGTYTGCETIDWNAASASVL
jgi:hypothetical protein